MTEYEDSAAEQRVAYALKSKTSVSKTRTKVSRAITRVKRTRIREYRSAEIAETARRDAMRL